MSRHGPRGIYRQIAGLIKAEVVEGRLQPGELLPSEIELARMHGVSRMTVRSALTLLRDEGIIYTVRAEGSYVGPREAPKVRPQRKYDLIAGDIMDRIRAAHFPPGTALPPEIRLAAEYGVARDTIRAAIALLRHHGWVHTIPARATYVIAYVTPTAHPQADRGGPAHIVPLPRARDMIS